MNIMFWVLMILMLLLAIGLLVFPLLRVRHNTAIAYKESNLRINDEKVKELDIDLQEGRIDQDFYKLAREELDRELLIDIPLESQQTAAIHYTGTLKRHPAVALLISVFVPMLALLLYLELGMHSASDESFVAEQRQSQQQPQGQQPSVEEMTRKLEEKLEKEGGTVQEWAMLGRAHKHLGKYELAAKAFAVALEKDTGNAELMLESAEMIALNNNQTFNAEARDLVLKAYAIEPDNPNALWFAGVAEYQHGNYKQAIEHLATLLPLAAGEEDVMKSIVTIVTKSREQLIAAGEDVPELTELLDIKNMAGVTAQTDTQVAEVASGTILNIKVDISKEARERFKANDVIFVYAKAKQGPRMPLAAKRMTLADLPVEVVLDDSMAMVEGMNLSAFEQLEVSARVSTSGSAIAQSGDYIGRIDVDSKAANTSLGVIINTLVP